MLIHNIKKSRNISPWRVAVGCFFVLFACQAALQSFSIFMPSILKDLQVTTAGISFMTTVACVTGFFCNMLVDKLIHKIGCRAVLVIGSVSCVLNFIVYSCSQNLLHLYLGSVFAGIAIGFATFAPLSVVISNWFIRSYGTVWSMVVSGSMISGVIMYSIAGKLIEQIGWRHTYQRLSIAVGIISLFSALFLVIESPEKCGQKPYSGSGEKKCDADAAVGDLSLVEIKGSPTYALLLIGFFLLGLSTNSENFLPAFWQSNGLGVSTASNYMSIYAGFCAIASIVLGRITDKLNARVFQALTSVCFSAGLAGFAITQTADPFLILLFSFLFSFGAKKTSGTIPAIVFQYAFGRREYSHIAGKATAMLQLGIAVSSPMIGFLCDQSGSYRLPFLVMTFLGFATLFLLQIGMHLSPLHFKNFFERKLQ